MFTANCRVKEGPFIATVEAKMRMGFFLVPVSVFQACAVPTSCQRLLETDTFWIYFILKYSFSFFLNLHKYTIGVES